MSTPYHRLAALAGHPDAQALADELMRWHDRMVAHVRRHGPTPPVSCCDDECPVGEARSLWALAQRVFGQQAFQLTFLHAQAGGHS